MEAQNTLWFTGAVPETGTVYETAQAEAEAAKTQLPKPIRLDRLSGEGEEYTISETAESYIISGSDAGLLYGVYALLEAFRGGNAVPAGKHAPAYGLRMLNCWDNTDGSIERGYAGRSLWFDHDLVVYDPARIRHLARNLASVGINTVCINNVNVHEPALSLIEGNLDAVSKLAGIFRAYHIRIMLSVNFAHPYIDGLATADPLDPAVRDWWAKRSDLVYSKIPDLAGFLVKADSEGRPGPYTYGRSHADGANMLAEALAKHGGLLVWRCFVYNCRQDWRDKNTDRPKAAYEHYHPLDGLFAENVILQVKNGPFDFQIREPVSPLLLSMPKTKLALEVQLAQEYTGQQIDIYSMPGLFREIWDAIGSDRIMAAAAVSNFGNDLNYTGHPFAALNLYAFGRFAWDPCSDPEEVTRDWIRLTYPEFSAGDTEQLLRLLTGSREVYEKYTTPLGLGWMITPNTHYGPSPEGYEYQAWGTYHRADRNAVGIDRTSRGTGYTEQYPAALRDLYEDPATCPENLLLFFHRLRYDTVLKDGRTLIQRLYDDHFEGAEAAEQMAEVLGHLPFPERDAGVIRERMEAQRLNAREWRDIINTYFHRLSGVDDAGGRKIYD